MATPSVTNSFTAGSAALASQVNANFSDIINGVKSGSTWDVVVNSLTTATATITAGTITTCTISGAATVGTTLGVTGATTLTGAATLVSTLTQTMANLAKTSAPTADTLYPNSMVKAWATLTMGAAGAVTVDAGFNVDTATWSNTELTVNFHTNLSDANFAVSATQGVVDIGSAVFSAEAANKAVGLFILDKYRADTGAGRNWAANDEVMVVVLGNQ